MSGQREALPRRQSHEGQAHPTPSPQRERPGLAQAPHPRAKVPSVPQGSAGRGPGQQRAPCQAEPWEATCRATPGLARIRTRAQARHTRERKCARPRSPAKRQGRTTAPIPHGERADGGGRARGRWLRESPLRSKHSRTRRNGVRPGDFPGLLSGPVRSREENAPTAGRPASHLSSGLPGSPPQQLKSCHRSRRASTGRAAEAGRRRRFVPDPGAPGRFGPPPLAFLQAHPLCSVQVRRGDPRENSRTVGE